MALALLTYASLCLSNGSSPAVLRRIVSTVNEHKATSQSRRAAPPTIWFRCDDRAIY